MPVWGACLSIAGLGCRLDTAEKEGARMDGEGRSIGSPAVFGDGGGLVDDGGVVTIPKMSGGG